MGMVVDHSILKNVSVAMNLRVYCKFSLLTCRRDICHKHHKQRLCKIISTGVKLHFVKILLEQLLHVLFQFLVIFSHSNQ